MKSIFKKLLSISLAGSLIVTSFFMNGDVSEVRADSGTYKPVTNLNGEYKYVWGDEFEGDALDLGKWSADSSKMGGRNVLIVEKSEKTISVQDGALKLTAYKDDEGNYHVPNSVHTKETMNFLYGYVEIRAKLSLEIGSFASFWTRSVSDPGMTLAEGSLDHYAEVDMFETFRDKEGNLCAGGGICKNFLGEDADKKNWYSTPMSWTQHAVVPDEEYHVFGYEWTPEEINLYYDGTQYARLDITESWTGNTTEGKGLPGWVCDTTRFTDKSGTGMECFNEPQYLIFNHHLHHKDGFKASTSVTENTDFKYADYVIDYCRVFQKADQKIYAHTHTWDGGKITKAETCTEDGIKKFSCSGCDMKRYEKIKAHHSWDEGRVTKEATETDEGEMTYTCKVCQKTKIESIPKKQSSGEGEISSEEQNTEENNTEEEKITSTEQNTSEDKQDSDKKNTSDEVATEKQNTSEDDTKENDSSKKTSDNSSDFQTEIKKNMIVTDKKSRSIYKISKVVKKNGKITGGNVIYVKPLKKTYKSVTIPSYIKVNGKKFYVTKIGSGAFKGYSKLKKIIIGKNVKSIGKKAFYGCKNLKTIKIKTNKLTKKTVQKNAFKNINAKAKITVPKDKLKIYKKILKAMGVTGKKQKIKK